jgi:UDP-N-acetylglucosamine:LPS N-acetylglucosamine transferase
MLLSAPVGESHTLMAQMLAAELEARADVESVSIAGDFSVLGPVLDRVLSRGFRFHLGRVGWSYDLAYRLFSRVAAAQWFAECALYGLGGAALAREIRRRRPHVVVSTYPVMNPVLARLRASGRIDCRVAAVVAPLGGLAFWVHPALDLHMTLYPEALGAVSRLARRGRVEAVRPLVGPEFYAPGRRDQTRAELGVEPGIPLVLISGGGWGAGDLAGALETCLALPDVRVLALAGRNQPLRAELAASYGANPRATVLGFTDRMRELLWAADVFISATAGTSCIEAQLCGCPTVTYGFAFGHVRDNTRALAERGLARRAELTGELSEAVRAALAGGRRPIPPLAELPSAAELVVALASPRRHPVGAV